MPRTESSVTTPPLGLRGARREPAVNCTFLEKNSGQLNDLDSVEMFEENDESEKVEVFPER